MSAVLELAKELIARPSLTPDDQGCQQLIAARLAKLGFKIEHLRFGQVDNLWARYGSEAPLLVFAGHTDVVPTGPKEQWHSDPFTPTIRNGLLYGRGAADMKGGLAAMVVAVEQFFASLPQKTNSDPLSLRERAHREAMSGLPGMATLDFQAKQGLRSLKGGEGAKELSARNPDRTLTRPSGAPSPEGRGENTKPRLRGSIAFLITSDEEGPSVDGTIRVVEVLQKRGEKIDWCVLGEPSCLEKFGDTIRHGRRGSLTGLLTVHGIQGHVAYPDRADNPIHRVLPALAELCKATWDARPNPHFPPTSFQISNFHSGTGAGNVIPGEAAIRFNFRYSTAVTAAELKNRVEDTLKRHGVHYSIEWRPMGEPFLTQPGKLSNIVQDSVEKVTGLRPKLDTGGGTSDGRYLAPAGAEVIEFGPMNASIHKIDECVAVSELDSLVEIYYGIGTKLLCQSF